MLKKVVALSLFLSLWTGELGKAQPKEFEIYRERSKKEIFSMYLADFWEKVEMWNPEFYEGIESYLDSCSLDEVEFAELVFNSVERGINDYGFEDEALILALVQKESAFYPLARNGNDYGIMQINRINFKPLGLDDWRDVEENISAGIKYFMQQYKRYGKEEFAVMAYNNPSLSKKLYEAYKKGGKIKLSNYGKSVMEIREAVNKYFEENKVETLRLRVYY